MSKRGLLRKCRKCNIYTLEEKCPICKGLVVSPHPAKFSPEDKYGKYRRMMKKITLLKNDP